MNGAKSLDECPALCSAACLTFAVLSTARHVCAPQAVLQIREFSTGGPFDDQQDIDFPNLPLIKPALPQLSPDPADWLPPSARQGSRSTISFSAGA